MEVFVFIMSGSARRGKMVINKYKTLGKPVPCILKWEIPKTQKTSDGMKLLGISSPWKPRVYSVVFV